MIVVTGATGNVGRRLVRVLAEAGEQVGAVSRRPATADDAVPGVRYVQADLAEPAGLKAAFEGADALFLLVAGEDPQGVLDAAVAAGVRRVVLLSSQGAGTRPESYRHPRAFEDALRRSDLDWTILRPCGFYSNAFRWAEPVRAHATIAAPFPDTGLPFVDPDDIAAVAAVVLREDGHLGATYELTGPAVVSPREQAAAIAAALGTPVTFVEQTRAEARAQLTQVMPAPVADATLAILGEPSAVEATVSPAVEAILGRGPGGFAEWAVRNVRVFG